MFGRGAVGLLFLSIPLPFFVYETGVTVLPNAIVHLFNLHHIADVAKASLAGAGPKGDQHTFEFIIVGGGTAGCLLANRLSRSHSVLLLESGGSPHPLTSVPAMFTSIQSSPHVNYGYTSVPQPNSCAGLDRRQSYWPQGKGLGGTSNMNALLWVKGHDLDYDNWANLTGDYRWSSSYLSEVFSSLEDREMGGVERNMRDKVKQGSVHVRKLYSRLGDHLIRAAEEMGYPHVDTNRPYGRAGFDHFFLNTRGGLRDGAYEAFLRSVITSPNLTIRKFATVTKILFDTNSSTPEAIGVEYLQTGLLQKAFASKETIICAGVIESPKLLLLSGIGPKADLDSLNIEVVKNLRGVGENLQDHLVSMLGPVLINQSLSIHPQHDMNLKTITEYIGTGGGLISTTGYLAGGYVTSSTATEAGQSSWPDIQFVMHGGSISDQVTTQMIQDRCHTKPGLLNEFYKACYGKTQYSFVLAPVLVRPKSRGSLKLRGKDPHLMPLIDPRYLEHRDDVKVLIEGLHIAVKMVTGTGSFQSLAARINPTPFPGCEEYLILSDEYFDCFIRSFTVAGGHGAGTCAMGRGGGEDPSAVVDSDLRVIGVRRLRVADASVIPVLPSGNIQWPCFVIGQMAADFILNTYL